MDTERIEKLRASFQGKLVLPEDSEYHEFRKVFSAMHDKRPGVIARCASTGDVVVAVNFARQNGLVIAVRCGGHSVYLFRPGTPERPSLDSGAGRRLSFELFRHQFAVESAQPTPVRAAERAEGAHCGTEADFPVLIRH